MRTTLSRFRDINRMVCEKHSSRNRAERADTGRDWLLLMNKLESWAGSGHCVLLLLQWLQDAPAYRDMQGGGAGLSAPAA